MSYKNCPLNEVLDDLAVRFILNIPDEERCDLIRVSFQIEEAHWFFEDFVRIQNPLLPSFSLRTFSLTFFKHLPFLNPYVDQHDELYSQFLAYKFRVPVCGAIMLNPTLDKALFVKGWSGRASWGFPRGKINIGEQDTECAVREVQEEVGFDIRSFLVKSQYLEVQLTQQRVKLYIIPCVPETMEFNPKTRKEISKIEWHPLSRFANSKGNRTATVLVDQQDHQNYRYFMVAPFINQLLNWIKKYRFSDRFFQDLARHQQNAPLLEYYQELAANGVDLQTLVREQRGAPAPILQLRLPDAFEYDLGATLDNGYYDEELPPSQAGEIHPWNCFEFQLEPIFTQAP